MSLYLYGGLIVDRNFSEEFCYFCKCEFRGYWKGSTNAMQFCFKWKIIQMRSLFKFDVKDEMFNKKERSFEDSVLLVVHSLKIFCIIEV